MTDEIAELQKRVAQLEEELAFPTDIPEYVKAFEDWFFAVEGFALRAERFEGDEAWLRAAFEAGAVAERERGAEGPRGAAERHLGNGPHNADRLMKLAGVADQHGVRDMTNCNVCHRGEKHGLLVVTYIGHSLCEKCAKAFIERLQEATKNGSRVLD